MAVRGLNNQGSNQTPRISYFKMWFPLHPTSPLILLYYTTTTTTTTTTAITTTTIATTTTTTTATVRLVVLDAEVL